MWGFWAGKQCGPRCTLGSWAGSIVPRGLEMRDGAGGCREYQVRQWGASGGWGWSRGRNDREGGNSAHEIVTKHSSRFYRGHVLKRMYTFMEGRDMHSNILLPTVLHVRKCFQTHLHICASQHSTIVVAGLFIPSLLQRGWDVESFVQPVDARAHSQGLLILSQVLGPL